MNLNKSTKPSIGKMIDVTTIPWDRVDGVDLELWRAAFDLAGRDDEILLDVWFQADEDRWLFHVSTEIYGEIAHGNAMTMVGAKMKAIEAAACEYPAET